MHGRERVLIRDGYYVEVSVSDGKNILWEVVEYHVVEEGKENNEIGLRGFD